MSILMEDLLKEITTLSSRLDESQSDSNSTSGVGQQNIMAAPGIDSLKMRNKARSKKRRGKKRRIDCHPELYTESETSCSDTSEDEAIRDYIENVTGGAANASRPIVSDSDEDFVPRRRAVKKLPLMVVQTFWNPPSRKSVNSPGPKDLMVSINFS